MLAPTMPRRYADGCRPLRVADTPASPYAARLLLMLLSLISLPLALLFLDFIAFADALRHAAYSPPC